MKSIVVGYADEAGRTDRKVICGPEVSDKKQAEVFSEAKYKQKFPKGIKRLELAFFDPHLTEVAIQVVPATEVKKEKN